MTKVVVKNGNVDNAIKMWSKKVARSGVPSASKNKLFYVKPGAKRRKAKAEGIKNTKKRSQKERYN